MHFSPSPPTSQWPWPWPQVASRKKQRQSVSVWLLSEASILVLDIQFLWTAVHAVLSLFGIILSSFLSLSIFLESLPALEKPIKRKRKQRINIWGQPRDNGMKLEIGKSGTMRLASGFLSIPCSCAGAPCWSCRSGGWWCSSGSRSRSERKQGKRCTVTQWLVKCVAQTSARAMVRAQVWVPARADLRRTDYIQWG